MADTITHLLFSEKIKETSNYKLDHSCFNLGNMGPDIYFYYMLFLPPKRKESLEIASILHKNNPYDFLSTSSKYAKKSKYKKELTDYLKGYAAHFYLDSFVHPFINSSSMKYKNGHKRLELAIDTLLLKKIKNQSSVKYNFRNKLKIEDNILHEIAYMYKYSLNNLYNIKMAPNIFIKGYKHFLFTLRLLQDRFGIKQLIQKIIEKITNRHEHYRYLNYSRKVESRFDYMNLKKSKWRNIVTKKEEKLSFIEIFELAYEEYMKSDILYSKNLENPSLYSTEIDFSGHNIRSN